MKGGGDDRIFVVSAAGQGHLLPCLELCKHLSFRNYNTTLILPSSSSLPDLTQYPLIQIASISAPPMMMMTTSGSDSLRQQAAADLESHLSNRSNSPVLCAIIDFQMGWTKGLFRKYNIPVVGFFTFGACAAAMEWAAWKADVGNMKPDEVRLLNGLPDEMALSYTDLKRRQSGPPPGGGGGPPKPGDRPPWVQEVEGSVALMFNTCDDLERPFLNYMADQMGLPVWGVGPLLPEQYWKSFNSIIRDRDVRSNKRETNFTEDEILQWLDLKPHGSVLYVAFGSEVGPTKEEYHQLAQALEESTRSFIWAIQSKSPSPHAGLSGSKSEKEGEGYFPYGLDKRVGERGLIIHGWAPQLMILSHPSTGGFLSHCGWNSSAEAIGRGIPIVAWPKRGDQYYNAKLLVNYLKIGYMATSGDASVTVKKDDILKGIERLMSDEEAKKRAVGLCAKYELGFPTSSKAALDAFGDSICQRPTS